MVIVGDNTNTVGSLTISNNTGSFVDWKNSGGFVDWKTYENLFPKYRYPTSDGDSPVSNALVENYTNVFCPYRMKRVIFHNPATIVYWQDGSKTVVKCKADERYDKEKGLAMCLAKKLLGTEFHSTFKEWCKDGA